jgi:hypothetical protein
MAALRRPRSGISSSRTDIEVLTRGRAGAQKGVANRAGRGQYRASLERYGFSGTREIDIPALSLQVDGRLRERRVQFRQGKQEDETEKTLSSVHTKWWLVEVRQQDSPDHIAARRRTCGTRKRL